MTLLGTAVDTDPSIASQIEPDRPAQPFTTKRWLRLDAWRARLRRHRRGVSLAPRAQPVEN